MTDINVEFIIFRVAVINSGTHDTCSEGRGRDIGLGVGRVEEIKKPK